MSALINDKECTEDLFPILVTDEGISRTAYKDTRGNWTIGVGYFIGKELKDITLSRHVIFEMLKEKISQAALDAKDIFGDICHLKKARRAVIISLLFNMGKGNKLKGFLSFENMIAAIKEERWDDAAAELRDSDWAKQVDPKDRNGVGRDDRLIYMLKTGEYHPEYKVEFFQRDI